MDVGYITAQDVRRTLARIRGARSLTSCLLLQMEAVRLRTREEGLAITEGSLEWALIGLLHDVTLERLAELRSLSRQARIVEHDRRPEGEVHQLVADFRRGSTDLEAWSALYYRFLCPGLRVGPCELASLVCPGHHGRSAQRLFQRRVSRAVREMALMLRSLEHDAVRRRQDRAVDGAFLSHFHRKLTRQRAASS